MRVKFDHFDYLKGKLGFAVILVCLIMVLSGYLKGKLGSLPLIKLASTVNTHMHVRIHTNIKQMGKKYLF